jgi:hypothetical protein
MLGESATQNSLDFCARKTFFFDCEAFYRLHISEKFIPKPEHEMPLNPPQKSALHTLANWNRQPRVYVDGFSINCDSRRDMPDS